MSFVSNTDIDECAMESDNCAENAICMNIPGSFNCTCNEGYTGDGTSCVGKPVHQIWKLSCSSLIHVRPTVIQIVCTWDKVCIN